MTLKRRLLSAVGLCVAFVLGFIMVPDDDPPYFDEDDDYPSE